MVVRDDDFRCFDPYLVQILRGREMEAVEFAKKISTREGCYGLFVLGDEIDDWRFIGAMEGIQRLEVVKPNATFCSIDFSRLHDLKRLRLVNIKCGIDFSKMLNLEYLQFEWTKDCFGLDRLNKLKELHVYGIKGKEGAFALRHFPDGVRTLSITSSQLGDLDFARNSVSFDLLDLAYIRNLHSIPQSVSANRLELTKVGGAKFDYESIPENVACLIIDSGARIESWKFLSRLNALSSLSILRTK